MYCTVAWYGMGLRIWLFHLAIRLPACLPVRQSVCTSIVLVEQTHDGSGGLLLDAGERGKE